MTDKTSGKKKVSRRRFLKWTVLGGAAAVVGGGLDAFVIEPRWIAVTHPTIAVTNLPDAWDGARVAVLADFHVGPMVDLDFVRKAVALTAAEKPDVVVLVGDFVSTRDAITAKYAGALAKLQSCGSVFAVLGNHDYWTNAEAVRAMLDGAGITRLDNTHAIVRRDGQSLCLAGVDDLWEGKPRLDQALAGIDETVCRILLCHNPDYAEQMPAQPRVDLMLSGHTHGGQVKIPFGPRPVLPVKHKKYGAGLVTSPRCPVYITRGVGMLAAFGLPVRFNCRPEVAVITLKRRQD